MLTHLLLLHVRSCMASPQASWHRRTCKELLQAIYCCALLADVHTQSLLLLLLPWLLLQSLHLAPECRRLHAWRGRWHAAPCCATCSIMLLLLLGQLLLTHLPC
jgi:hypothetical protein